MVTSQLVRVCGEEVKTLRIVNGEVTRSNDWRRLVATFVATTDVKPSSQKLYSRTLSLFFKWIDETGRQLPALDAEDIKNYKEHLLSSGLSALSVGSYIISVRKFYEWAEAYKLYPNIARGIKPPRRKQAFKKMHLEDDKSKELLEHFSSLSLRDYAIVNLMLRTGLRTIEVVRADVGDICFMGGKRVLKVWGKGHDEKDDFVVLTEKAYEPIKNYLDTARKGAKAGEPLFTSNSRQNKGERLTTRTISGLCKGGLQAIGLDGREYTAHSLRHTTAVAILNHEGTMFDVQAVLRHTSPQTSQIYTESIKQQKRLQDSPESKINDAF